MWISGFRPDYRVDGIDRVVEVAGDEENAGEVDTCLGIFGLKLDGAAIGIGGFIWQPSIGEHVAQVEMGLRIFRVKLDRPLDELGGFIFAAGLVGKNAQEMGDVSVFGVVGKELAVGLLGLGQAAGAVVFDGGLEGLVTHILN